MLGFEILPEQGYQTVMLTTFSVPHCACCIVVVVVHSLVAAMYIISSSRGRGLICKKGRR